MRASTSASSIRGQTDYEGVIAGGVTTTIVTAEAMQRLTDVDINPRDDDGDGTNGHQIALAGVAGITVTVTSADGSRIKVYRVIVEGAAPDPWPHCLRGDVAEGFSLVVYEGGSVEELAACAESREVVALYSLHEGAYISFILGAPDSVNEGFSELYADGVPALTPLVASSAGPPSADPVGDIGVPRSWPACLRGEVDEGFSLVIYEGGSVEDLESCAGSHAVTALYSLGDGEWVSHILGAPALVNGEFRELFADGLPAGTALVVKSDGPPTPASDGDGAAGNGVGAAVHHHRRGARRSGGGDRAQGRARRPARDRAGPLLMGTVGASRDSVRGILVAGSFDPRAVMAARAVPALQLRAYSFEFAFAEP